MAKKLTLSDKIDRIAMEATPEQLPALLDRFQLAVKFRTTNGTQPAKRRKAKTSRELMEAPDCDCQ
jgi:hypothetical protein